MSKRGSQELDYANYKKDLILNNFRLMQKVGVLLDYIGLQGQMTQEELDQDFSVFWSYEDLQ